MGLIYAAKWSDARNRVHFSLSSEFYDFGSILPILSWKLASPPEWRKRACYMSAIRINQRDYCRERPEIITEGNVSEGVCTTYDLVGWEVVQWRIRAGAAGSSHMFGVNGSCYSMSVREAANSEKLTRISPGEEDPT